MVIRVTVALEGKHWTSSLNLCRRCLGHVVIAVCKKQMTCPTVQKQNTKNIEHLLATMGLNGQPFKFQVHHKGEQGVLDNLTGQ